MNIYKKLNLDIQEKVDKLVWEKTKRVIPFLELVHRKLRLEWQEYPYDWEQAQRNVMEHFCQHILKPRVYACGYCGLHTASGNYEYINDIEENGEFGGLGYLVYKYCVWLENKNNTEKKIKKPSFEDLFDEMRLAIDNWIVLNIKCKYSFQQWAEKLGFNILDMFELWYDDIGDNPFDSQDYQKSVFLHYYCDYVERILLVTYNWNVEDLDSDSSDTETLDEFLLND